MLKDLELPPNVKLKRDVCVCACVGGSRCVGWLSGVEEGERLFSKHLIGRRVLINQNV